MKKEGTITKTKGPASPSEHFRSLPLVCHSQQALEPLEIIVIFIRTLSLTTKAVRSCFFSQCSNRKHWIVINSFPAPFLKGTEKRNKWSTCFCPHTHTCIPINKVQNLENDAFSFIEITGDTCSERKETSKGHICTKWTEISFLLTSDCIRHFKTVIFDFYNSPARQIILSSPLLINTQGQLRGKYLSPGGPPSSICELLLRVVFHQNPRLLSPQKFFL